MSLFHLLIFVSVTKVVEGICDYNSGETFVDDISLNLLEQDDPHLIETIKKIIGPPASKTTSYNFLKFVYILSLYQNTFICALLPFLNTELIFIFSVSRM